MASWFGFYAQQCFTIWLYQRRCGLVTLRAQPLHYSALGQVQTRCMQMPLISINCTSDFMAPPTRSLKLFARNGDKQRRAGTNR
jgi:hypothetical protein